MQEKQWLMAQVARMYYMEELTQEAIASKLHFSRSTVSRLLMDARREGIVRIEIHFPWQQDSRLEYLLCKRFKLNDARVLDSTSLSANEVLQGIGALGARYLNHVLMPGMTIAIATGTATYHVVRALDPRTEMGCSVVQLVGVVGTQRPQIDGTELARTLAERMGGTYHYLQSPLLVEDRETRDGLMQTPAIRQTLDLACRSQIAIVGVGTVDPDSSSMLHAGFFTLDEIKSLNEAGAVGEVAACLFDKRGESIRNELTARIMSIDVERLKAIPLVIGVAAGAAKARAIFGALRGGILDVLVTDTEAAKALLELMEKNPTGALQFG